VSPQLGDLLGQPEAAEPVGKSARSTLLDVLGQRVDANTLHQASFIM